MELPTNTGLVSALLFESLNDIAKSNGNPPCSQQDIEEILGSKEVNKIPHLDEYIEALKNLGTRATVKMVRYPGDLSDHRMLAFLQSQPIVVSVYRPDEMVNWSQVAGVLLLVKEISIECVTKYGRSRLEKIVDWVLGFLNRVPLLKGWGGLMGDEQRTEDDKKITEIIEETLTGRVYALSSTSVQQKLLEAFENFFIQRDNSTIDSDVDVDQQLETTITEQESSDSEVSCNETTIESSAAGNGYVESRVKKRGGAKRNKSKTNGASTNTQFKQQRAKKGSSKGNKAPRGKRKKSRSVQKAAAINFAECDVMEQREILERFTLRIESLRTTSDQEELRATCCQILADAEQEADLQRITVVQMDLLRKYTWADMEEFDVIQYEAAINETLDQSSSSSGEEENLAHPSPQCSPGKIETQKSYRGYATEVDSLKGMAANLSPTDFEGGKKLIKDLSELTREAVRRGEVLRECGPTTFQLHCSELMSVIMQKCAASQGIDDVPNCVTLFAELGSKAVTLKDINELEAIRIFIEADEVLKKGVSEGQITANDALQLFMKLSEDFKLPKPQGSADEDDNLATFQHFQVEIEALSSESSTLKTSADKQSLQSLQNRCKLLLEKVREKWENVELDDEEAKQIAASLRLIICSLPEEEPQTGEASSTHGTDAAAEVSAEEDCTTNHL